MEQFAWVVIAAGITSTSPSRSDIDDVDSLAICASPTAAFISSRGLGKSGALFYVLFLMPELSFLDLLAQLTGATPTARSFSARSRSTLLYATPHFRPDADRFERPSYFLMSATPNAGVPLYLTIKGARIEAIPFVPDLDAMPFGDPKSFEAPHWLVKMSGLCEQAIRPHLENLGRIPFFEEEEGKPNFTKVRCEQVIEDQVESFRYQRRAFFRSYEAWFEWECWSRSESWLKKEIDPESACAALLVEPGAHKKTMGKVLRSCRSALRKQPLHTEEWIDVDSLLKPPVTQQNAVVASVMEKYVDPTCIIGDPDLVFPKDSECEWSACLPGFNKSRNAAPQSLWWWRKLNSRDDSSDELCELFFQNWARSAFFYEYRGRRNRSTEQPWCGAPWVTLNHIQRAVLRELWPPEVAGPRTFVRPIVPAVSNYGALSRETLQIPVDLGTMSDAAILEQVQKNLTGLRAARGFPTVKQGGGGVSTSYRWKILEAMDDAFYKNQTLLAKDRTGKSKIEKRYKEACAEAGIEP